MKNMQKSHRFLPRALSGLMAALLLCLMPCTVLAEAPEAEVETAVSTETQPLFYDAASLPDSVRIAVDLSEDEQLMQTDDLYELRIEKEDGSGRAMVYTSPVKYIDEDGEVQLIDTAMTATSALTRTFSQYAYRNAAGAFTVEYGAYASLGLRVNGDFTLSPDSATESDPATVGTTPGGDGTILYLGAFGNGTILVQTNTTTGVRQEIVLPNRAAAQNVTYTFSSDEYTPVLRDGGAAVDIVANGTDEVVYTLSSLYLSDSYTPTSTPSTVQHFDDFGSTYTLTQTDEETWTIELSLEYHMRDLYDWDENDHSNFGIITPSDMATLHQTGWARSFEIDGHASISLSWEEGQRVGEGGQLSYELSNGIA